MRPIQSPERSDKQTQSKKPFEEPKLTYVKPKLKKEGKVVNLTTQSFFGSFSP